MSYRLSNVAVSKSREISKEKEIKSKILFFVEGSKTEIIYLQALRRHLPNDKNIEIEIFDRWKDLSGESNQLNIVVMVKSYLDKCTGLGRKKRALIEQTIEKLEFSEWTMEEMIEIIEKLKNDIGDNILSSRDLLKSQLHSIKTCYDFDKERDRICFVLDRDYKSFKENQFDEVVEICNSSSFELGISSPNFEFFLLLHITDMTHFDKASIFENEKSFTETQIKTLMREEFGETFKKEKYNGDLLISRFPQFLDNAENYSTNNIQLKTEVGSSLGKIVNSILNA